MQRVSVRLMVVRDRVDSRLSAAASDDTDGLFIPPSQFHESAEDFLSRGAGEERRRFDASPS